MKPQIKYGIVLAIINFLWILIIYVLGLSHSPTGLLLVFLSLIFSIVICVLIVKEQKKAQNGFISFGKAFNVGFITIFIASLLGIIFQQIYVQFIDTTYMEYMTKELPVQIAEKFGAPEQSLDQLRAKLEETPVKNFDLWQIAKGIMGSAFFAVIISLIVAAIMKKPNPDPFADISTVLDN